MSGTRESSYVNTLMMVVLRADRTASGLAFRLMVAWKYIHDNYPDKKTFLLTNKTLWERVFPGEDVSDYSRVYCFNDQQYYKLKGILLWVWSAWIILRNGIKTVHSSGSPLFYPLLLLKPILRFKNCVTIGSASIEQASSYRKTAAAEWERFIRQSDAIDILNPTHSLGHVRCRKYVSPCSFPFILQGHRASDLPFNYSPREDNILFIGSLIPLKNPDKAIQGFKRFLEKQQLTYSAAGRQPKLILLGKGNMASALREQAGHINQSAGYEAVQFVENDSLIIDCLKGSKVFLSIQETENYPSQSLMEAMLFNQSIIANDVGDTRLLVREEDGNVLLPALDENLLGDAIHELLYNWTPNGNNHDFIRTHHSLERFAAYLVNIHQEL